MRVLWFHGSSVQEPDRGFPEEFDRMRGATLSRTTGLRPRPQAEVTVRFPEPRHPITDGLPAEWAVVNDDVLTGAQLDPSATVLRTVFDDVETYRRAGWPNAHTPVDVPPGGVEDLPGMDTGQALAWANLWGAGRSISIVLGHDWDTFRKIPFMTLLVRGGWPTASAWPSRTPSSSPRCSRRTTTCRPHCCASASGGSTAAVWWSIPRCNWGSGSSAHPATPPCRDGSREKSWRSWPDPSEWRSSGNDPLGHSSAQTSSSGPAMASSAQFGGAGSRPVSPTEQLRGRSGFRNGP